MQKESGVPVEESVAAILRPMCPDLPKPVTTTLPDDSRMVWTAPTKDSPKRDAARLSSSASKLRASLPHSRTFF